MRLSLSLPSLLILSLSIACTWQSLAQSPTRYGSSSELEGDITCGKGTGGIHTYLETAQFRIYICGDEEDQLFPRFYRSFNTDGSPGLNIFVEDYDPREGRYLVFQNEGYKYILDSGNSQTKTALLLVKSPEEKVVLQEPASLYLSREASQDPGDQIATPSCSAGESLFITAVTASFLISICGGDEPQTYVTVAKTPDAPTLRLPIQRRNPEEDIFVAANGDILYTLTPQLLTVTHGEKILASEPVLEWN